MTISSVERPASFQQATKHHTINRTQSHEATRSEVEGHIQMLINEGNVFEARYYMSMVNKINGYPVISQMDFKRWHISYLRNQKSNIKSGSFQSEYQKAFMKLISN